MNCAKEILEEHLNRLNRAYENLVINGTVSKDSNPAIDNRFKVKQIEFALGILSEVKEINKITSVKFADWMIKNECSAPLTAGNVPLWFGDGIDGKTSEELYELFFNQELN
jgi:hypothetical protein